MTDKRRYPIGAEIFSKGVHFRVWAPDHPKVNLVLEVKNEERHMIPMHKEAGGYFSISTPKAAKDSLYFYHFPPSKKLLSDPASRYQPEGPSGPSCVIDTHYPWTDREWPGLNREGQIIYEMHMGTFTEEGTYEAAESKLKNLVSLGITIIELMPLNEFPGRFGWGYDGVNLFAPYHHYGTPSELKSFINHAHSLGLGVLLDVVYNHLGPEGNAMVNFAKEYLTKTYCTEWGQGINFDSHSSREFFLTNVRYWIEEYHFDGLRVDATSCIKSKNSKPILADLTRTAKKAGKKRSIIVVGENEPEDKTLILPYSSGGYGFDALWNDDFHHTACVRLTGKREAYYTDYLGTPQEFISTFKHGFLYQGQYYLWQKKERGTPALNLNPASYITFLENHDQVANSGEGQRLYQYTDQGNYKALLTLLLLGPQTPMLFQGQEFGSSAPFCYFGDHSEEINRMIRKGRFTSLALFARLDTDDVRKSIPDPTSEATFLKSKLKESERQKKTPLYELHKELINLRKTDPIFKKVNKIPIEGAVLGPDTFIIRYFGEEQGDRLLVVNFGQDNQFSPAPQPLLVAGDQLKWELLFSSEWMKFGGQGMPVPQFEPWEIPGHSAYVLQTKQITKKELNLKKLKEEKK